MKRILMLVPVAGIITGCSPTSPTLTSVSVTCGATSIGVGQTTQCSATATLSGDSTMPEVTGVIWRSSNTSNAIVNAAGSVTGVSAGGTIAITATFQNVSGTALITVTVPAPPTVTLKMGCPGLSAPPTVCLANLESDLYYTTSGAANASYLVSFGDGQTCGPSLASCGAQQAGFPSTKFWFPHTYPAGIFQAQLTVTDASGQAMATATVIVKSLSGTCIAGSGSDGCTGQRTLHLTQMGTSLTGSYTNPLSSTSALSGAVAAIRDVSITPAPGLVFSGMYIDGRGVNADASALILQITTGDPTCGQPTLTFGRQ